MTQRDQPLIFDGHNDVLFRLYENGTRGSAKSFMSGRQGHIDLGKSKTGGLAGGFFAIYVPSSDDFAATMSDMQNPPYDLPLPELMLAQEALPIAMHQASLLMELEKLGAVKICTEVAHIRACLDQDPEQGPDQVPKQGPDRGPMAAIMHMEGAEAIDLDLFNLDVFYRAGLRSLGPVWSRPTIFGDGVPFAFPSTGDIGSGLTDAGIRLVKRCDELGIMLDVSHLNKKGFWDIEKTSANPLVATHSNAHAITPHARNLTDKQLAAIKERKGMVGLNFAVAFTRKDGAMNEDTPLEDLMRHLDYLIEKLGEDHVGLGSDFDGAHIPKQIKHCGDLIYLRDAMRAHGFDEALMQKICHKNWISLLDRIWK